MSFEDLIENEDWVFWDLFDTIIRRNVSDRQIIEGWAFRLAPMLRYCLSARELVEYRRKALLRLFRLYPEREEFAFDDIMHQLYIDCHVPLGQVTEKEFFEYAMSAEIEAECGAQTIIPRIMEEITAAKDAGKKTGIISDYYHHADVVRLFLSKAGFKTDAFDLIFVSADYGYKKKSGRLYRIVLEEIGKNTRCLMIGDNPDADGNRAREAGFDAEVRPAEYPSAIDISGQLLKLKKKYQSKPFALYGFGFYTFISRIYEYAVKNGIEKLVFLSREGFLLKKMFDLFQERRQIRAETVYLYVSRKSTFLPSLEPLEEESFDVIFTQYGDISLSAFLQNLQFSSDIAERIAYQLNVKPDDIIYDFRESEVWTRLKKNAVFVEEYERVRQAARVAAVEYIENTIGREDEIILVDIGWKGTMQDNLFNLWNGRKKLTGLYYGIYNRTGRENDRNLKLGLIFDKYPAETLNYGIWEFETHLIEQMLAAPHGSTEGYQMKDGRAAPVLEQTREDQSLYERVQPIQQECLKLVRELIALFENRADTVDDYRSFVDGVQLRAELIVSEEMVAFEKEALSEKTNNFGWFGVIPMKKNVPKGSRLKKAFMELKRIAKEGDHISLMRFLGYAAVKMNARERYAWKRFCYRVVYLLEKHRVEGGRL